MTPRRLSIILLLAALAGWASPAAAGPPISVRGFAHATFTIFGADGAPLGRANATDFTVPTTSSSSGLGASVGLELHGAIVYVRRLDLILDSPPCLGASQARNRDADAQMAGERMGAGASYDCVVQ